MIIESKLGNSREISLDEMVSRVPISDTVTLRQEIELPSIKSIKNAAEIWGKANIVDIPENSAITHVEMSREYKYFKNKLSENPDSVTLKIKLGSVAGLLNNYQEAVVYLADASKSNDSLWIKYRLAEAYSNLGDNDEALNLYSELAECGHSGALLRIAENKLLQRNLHDARKLISRAKKMEDADWRVYLFDGAVSLLCGEPARAINSLRAALEFNDRLPNAYTWLAIAHHVLGNKRHVVADLKKALFLNPVNQTALLALADIASEELLSLDSIKQYLEFYSDECDQGFIALERLAYICYLTDNFKNGIRYLRQHPHTRSHPGLMNNLGVLLSKNGEKREAITAYYSAISLNRSIAPNGYDAAVVNLIKGLIDSDNAAKAIRIGENYLNGVSFDSASCSDPAYKILINLSIAYLSVNDPEKALEICTKMALSGKGIIEGKIDASCIVASHLTMEMNNPSEGMEFARNAYSLAFYSGSELDVDVKRRAANCYLFNLIENDDLDTAKDHLQDLSRYGVGDTNMATRGLYFIKLGNLEKGEKLYRRAAAMQEKLENKRLFLQKMYVELARAELKTGQLRIAERHLKKAKSMRKVGFPIPVSGLRKEIDLLADELLKRRTGQE